MRSFAVYRLPFAEECTMLVQHSAPSELSSLTELDGKEGFVIAPFSPSADCPILLLQPDEVRMMPVKEVQSLAKEKQEYNALISLTEERALEKAKEIDQRLKNGEEVGELAGVPFVAKDNFLVFGSPSTASSKMLENFETPIQATAVEKLEEAGAICIGKSNLDAFAHGGSTENSAFGVTKNSVDEARVAGGSSGGSAVITALDVVPFALGVFAKTAKESELVMRVMAGLDSRDAMTLPDFWQEESAPKKAKIGVVKEFLGEGVDPEVRKTTEEYIEKMRKAGHEIMEVSLPMSKYSLAIYYIVVPAEVSSNLARYDGIRYGLRSKNAKNLGEVFGKSRDEGFEAENKRRIMIGSYVLSSGFYDAYYLKAQKARTLLIDEFNKLFEEVDFLVGPVAPTPAFKIGENAHDPVKMYLADILSVPASLAGLPAVSIPAGKTKEGLPVGVQIIGKMESDAKILALADDLEES